MRLRLLAIALGLALVAAVMSREVGPGAATRPAPRRPAPASHGSVAASGASREWREPSRNLFEYSDAERRLAPEPIAPAFVPRTEPSAAAAVAPVRLVGLVRRADGLKAALAFDGEVVVLGPGESWRGYTLVSVDEEGVRLTGPEAAEIALALPEG